MNVQIIFYSMYGHIYKMALAVAEGAREVEGAEVSLYQVPELVPTAALEASGAKVAREAFAHIPFAAPAQLADADAIIIGTPTRFGNMCSQMRNFLDQTGRLWSHEALVGKVASVFSSTNTQHGGQETTILTTWVTLAHHGMILVPIGFAADECYKTDGAQGGTPYGATTIAGRDGKRQPNEAELRIARYQGRHVAEITRALLLGRQA